MIVKYYVYQINTENPAEVILPKFLFFVEKDLVKLHDKVDFEDSFFQVVLLEFDENNTHILNAFCKEVPKPKNDSNWISTLNNG